MAHPALDIRNKIFEQHPQATVVGRGRNWIKHDLGNGEVNWTGTIGPIHFGSEPFDLDTEIDSTWIEADPVQDAPWLWKMTKAGYHVYFAPGDDTFNSGQIVRYVDPDPINGDAEVTFQAQQVGWTNDLDQLSPVGDPANISPTSLVGDTITYIDAFGPGIDFTWVAGTARLAKHLVLNNLVTPPQFIIDGGNPMLRVPFIFQVSGGVEIYVDGVLWDTNTPLTTFTNIEFRVSGVPRWWFKAPNAWDTPTTPEEDPVVPILSQRVRRSGNNLLVDVLVPWSWLEGANYPVTIDPTVDRQVGSSDGDAFEDQDDTDFTSTAQADNVKGSPTASIRRDAGMYYSNVTVPNGATITAATSDVYVVTATFDDPECTIDLEDVDNADDFGTTADVAGRTPTGSGTSWSEDSIGTGWQTCPDFAGAVQDVVDRGGWASGQAIVVLWKGNDATAGWIQFYQYDFSDGSSAPKVSITYSSSSPSASPSASPSEGTPSASPSEGTPSASPSEGTPSASPSEGTPSASPSEGTPSASPSEGTPSASPSEGTPSASPSASGDAPELCPVCWGHVTGVAETALTFAGNWVGTGQITGAGDGEAIELEANEYMVSECVDTGNTTVTIEQNVYDPTGDDVTLEYRHGATEAACYEAGWNNYVGAFLSLGYIQVRLTSTL